MIGTILGNRYEIIELVGTGGMANVYKAKCTLLNRFVAIKVLKNEFKDDEETIKRFNIESQAVAGLSHTNIVSVFDVGAQDDIHYIVMEYVEGVTLKEYLKESGALVWNKAIDFSLQICSALQHAHRKGIVHRDIKPHNIMVTKDDVLKVMDFGIARAVSSYTTKIDAEALGTAHYCSPEQARGGYTDERSDIYSLGVVMYEMLTGKLPFESDNSVSVAIKQIQEAPVPPTEIVPTIPASVEEIVLKAMEKESVNRFQTANTLLIELNWIKQTETMPRAVKHVKTEEEKFETKKINIGTIPQAETTESVEKEKTEKGGKSMAKTKNKVKAPMKKEDKTAVIAAIISSIVIVSLLGFMVISFMFPTILPWNREPATEMEAPNLVGYKYESAVKKYKDIVIEKIEEEYSANYAEGYIISQTPDAGSIIEIPFEISVTVSKGSKEVKVPDIVNLDIEEAKKLLEEREINYKIINKESNSIPEGIVMSVNPGVNKTVYANVDAVVVTVSEGEAKVMVDVPDVLGVSEAIAKNKLSQANLKAVVKPIASSEPSGTVVKQSIPEDTSVEENSEVIIYVSTGESEIGTTTGTTSSREITVPLPSDKESVTVKVTRDGKIVYEKKHNTSEGAVSVVVKGTGTQKIVTYVDNVVVGEKDVKF